MRAVSERDFGRHPRIIGRGATSRYWHFVRVRGIKECSGGSPGNIARREPRTRRHRFAEHVAENIADAIIASREIIIFNAASRPIDRPSSAISPRRLRRV